VTTAMCCEHLACHLLGLSKVLQSQVSVSPSVHAGTPPLQLKPPLPITKSKIAASATLSAKRGDRRPVFKQVSLSAAIGDLGAFEEFRFAEDAPRIH
jgi:hypothetical protein